MKPTEHRTGNRALSTLFLVWIAGTGLFFYLRFSFAFYYANEPAVTRLIEGLARW